MILGREPALILGALVAVLGILARAITGHSFDDGLQFNEALEILAPLLAAFGIRQVAFAPATVDELATKAEQRRAVERRKRNR